MFKETKGSGFLTLLNSDLNNPLVLWGTKIRGGHLQRLRDDVSHSHALDLSSNHVSNTYITCPADIATTLGVHYPYLNITARNLNKTFAFDVQVLDDKNVRRRFRVSSRNSGADVKPFTCDLPLLLEENWNQISCPLHDWTRRAYGTNYVETIRVQVYANCRIKRVYFSDRIYAEDELPRDFRFYSNGGKKEQNFAIRQSKM